MVYIRVPTFKTAINPSLKHTYAQDGNFTPLQKMMLTRNRIWGNIVGGNERSGYKELRKPLAGQSLLRNYQFNQLRFMFPFIRDYSKLNYRKEKYQDRKLRIFMRGMKIGQQKGAGKSMAGMAMFEMASKKGGTDAELGQKLGEASFSDDSLGISSDGN